MLKHILVTFLYFLILYFSLMVKEISKYSFGLCKKVLDGDTIVVNNQKIRLFGIDAPELDQKSSDGITIGKKATQYLRSKIEGKWIFYKIKGRGFYGRQLGIILYNNQNINEDLIEKGLVFPAFIKKESSYFLLNYLAFSLNLGIFMSNGRLAHPGAWRARKNHQ